MLFEFVFNMELYSMNAMKTKKAVVAILISGFILVGNMLPFYALSVKSNQEITVLNSDSTKIKNSQSQYPVKEKDDVKKSKGTSNLTYNFIYFLITKFIKANTIYRSR